MKIYTKTGDDGTTGLFGGARVSKANPRVEAYGTVDETNACIGLARANRLPTSVDEVLHQVQVDLFVVGAELACVPGKEGSMPMLLISETDVVRLERIIDVAETTLAPLKNFILPGGSTESAALHLARTVCRRAERAALGIAEPPPRAEVIRYLNRLSDLLFVLARECNAEANVPDTPWAPRS